MEDAKKHGCTAALVALATVPAAILARGFALSVMWGWFVVPLGVSAVGIWHAIGVLTIVTLLTYRGDLKTVDDKSVWDPVYRSVVWGILGPFVVLAFGWVYHALMVMP